MVRVILDPPPKPRRSAAPLLVTVLRMMFLLTGIGALGYYAYIYTDAKVYEAYENWSLDQQQQGRAPSIIAFLREATPLRYVLSNEHSPAKTPERNPAASAREQEPARPRAVAPRELIGRITIPRLGVHGIVKEGVDDKTLRRAVGHVPGTAMPGEDGNVGLAAHRDTFFRGLKDVRKNDRIRIETSDGAYEYQVDSIRIVKPNDVEVLASAHDARALTLVTCYPFYYVGNAPKRFIVRAKQVELKPRELQGS
jgi:sortase A